VARSHDGKIAQSAIREKTKRAASAVAGCGNIGRDDFIAVVPTAQMKRRPIRPVGQFVLPDFSTLSARLINGSTPLFMSAFKLSSLMSTGTPLPS
jgi:hypothetical protein